MRKLLAADFHLLRRNIVFWLAFCFMVASTVILVLSTDNMLSYDASKYTIEVTMFCMMPGIGIINAIWIHLLIGNDYDQGTIRNKFICGHQRSSIFFSHWLVACCGSLFILAASLVTSAVLSWYCFHAFMLDAAHFALVIISCVLLTIAYTAICVALAMNISRRASSVVCGMLAMLGLAIAASIIDSNITSILVYGVAVSPLTEKLLFFFYDLLPSAQCVQLNNMMFDRVSHWPLLSILLTIVVTIIGYLLFKRKDIK